MRRTLQGLHRGTLIRVRGAGRFRFGTISREPEANATHITYRADYNGGERTVPLDHVQMQRRRPRPTKATRSRKSEDLDSNTDR